jgi:hypothetical protein
LEVVLLGVSVSLGRGVDVGDMLPTERLLGESSGGFRPARWGVRIAVAGGSGGAACSPAPAGTTIMIS